MWSRKDSGQYWPSICHYMPSGCTALEYLPETRQMFIGQENGTVSQYLLSEDCNRLELVKDYLAHQGRVIGVSFAKHSSWILSASRDKTFCYHSTGTGHRIGEYTLESCCTALQYDAQAKCAFVGDYAGQIIMLRLDVNGCTFITTLKGMFIKNMHLNYVVGF